MVNKWGTPQAGNISFLTSDENPTIPLEHNVIYEQHYQSSIPIDLTNPIVSNIVFAILGIRDELFQDDIELTYVEIQPNGIIVQFVQTGSPTVLLGAVAAIIIGALAFGIFFALIYTGKFEQLAAGAGDLLDNINKYFPAILVLAGGTIATVLIVRRQR